MLIVLYAIHSVDDYYSEFFHSLSMPFFLPTFSPYLDATIYFFFLGWGFGVFFKIHFLLCGKMRALELVIFKLFIF